VTVAARTEIPEEYASSGIWSEGN